MNAKLLPLVAALMLSNVVWGGGNSTMTKSPTLTGTDIDAKLFTDQPAAFDWLNLQVINRGINLPAGWITSQASDNTQ